MKKRATAKKRASKRRGKERRKSCKERNRYEQFKEKGKPEHQGREVSEHN